MAPNFPNPGILRDVRKSISRLVAATLIGCSVFVTATVWFCLDRPSYGMEQDAFTTFFSGSFSFLWSVIVVSVAGVHETKCSKLLVAQGIEPPTVVAVGHRQTPAPLYAPSGTAGPTSFDQRSPPYSSAPYASSLGYTNPISSSRGDTPM